MRTRAALLVTSLAVIAAIATVDVALPDTAAGDARSLVLTTEGDVVHVDFEKGETTHVASGAVASADGSRLYRARIADQQTIVEEIDAATAEVKTTTKIRGWLDLRAVSPRGGAVALRQNLTGGNAYHAGALDTTNIVVVRSESAERRTYRLTGNFEPEAFSRDEKRLFLIEYWPPRTPDRYFVRQLHLDTGEVADVFSPEVGLEPEMRGRARGQAISPEGDFLYTLYALDNGSPSLHDHHAGGETRAFIHVLSLTEDWSHCVFLSLPFGRDGGDAYGLGLSPDGGTLAAVDRTTGALAVFDTEDHLVASEEVGALWVDGRVSETPVAVADDGTVYVGQYDLVTAIAAEDRSVRNFWAQSRVRALDVTADGRHLRVAVGSSVSVLERESGEEVTTLQIGAAVARFGPPAGYLEEVDVVCAC